MVWHDVHSSQTCEVLGWVIKLIKDDWITLAMSVATSVVNGINDVVWRTFISDIRDSRMRV